MYTENQIWAAIWEAAAVWREQGLRPVGMPDNYTGAAEEMLFKLAGGYIYKNGRLTGYDFDEIIQRLIRDGYIVLDTKAVQRQQDIADLPHSDIPELDKIRTKADVKRVLNLPKEALKKYANLRTGSPAFKEFNERIAAANKIDGPESIKPVGKNQPVSLVPAQVTEAHNLVSTMTVRDIGSTSSTSGRWKTLIDTQKRLKNSIDQMYAARVKPEVILEQTKQAITDAGNSSVC
jgi:hypothetical protein